MRITENSDIVVSNPALIPPPVDVTRSDDGYFCDAVPATQIDHSFEVQATWGQLTGKTGDFLVKSFQYRETAYPADVWIVDQSLYRLTYESIAPGKSK